ncbi:hypothetical protein AVEN_116090-1 [Araneus ventricosus]|uniref:Tc1-like transposase DDE domain-containing protein n=1 Tax=Araneus ventricosus TaxID=182803 RepID=A0A4Y1ZQD3_ARAVE|nr:hypothetical protein AVEN_116090-1 [Araneus ventricosus]
MAFLIPMCKNRYQVIRYYYVRLIGANFLLHDFYAGAQRFCMLVDYLQQQTIQRMEWPSRYPHLNPIEHVWDALGRLATAFRLLPQILTQFSQFYKKNGCCFLLT